jgi:hypothetical protein
MFEVPPQAWVGKPMEVATMTSSEITSVVAETDRALIGSVGGDSPSARSAWTTPAQGMASPRSPDRPAGAPELGRGTNPAMPAAAPRGVGHNVVVGQPPQAPAREPEIPYPRRHVLYAENAAAYLRSIARRDRLFDDIAADRELKERLTRSLDDCAELLEQIRRRNRR